MPPRFVNGLLLHDLRLEHQTAHQFGKVTYKVCEESKECGLAFWEAAIKDNQVVRDYITQSDNPVETIAKLAAQDALLNGAAGVYSGENNLAQSAAVGTASAKQIADMKKELDAAKNTVKKASKTLDQIDKFDNETKTCSDLGAKKLGKIFNSTKVDKTTQMWEGVEKRRFSRNAFHQHYVENMQRHGVSKKPKGWFICNKPEQNKDFFHPERRKKFDVFDVNSFNTTSIRNGKPGAFISPYRGRESSNSIFIENLNNESNSMNLVIQTILEHKKSIICAILVSTGIYILFQNRKKIKPFLRKIRQIFNGPIKIYRKIKNSRVIKFYQRVKNSKLINNRITRPVWIIMRYNMRNPI